MTFTALQGISAYPQGVQVTSQHICGTYFQAGNTHYASTCPPFSCQPRPQKEQCLLPQGGGDGCALSRVGVGRKAEVGSRLTHPGPSIRPGAV